LGAKTSSDVRGCVPRRNLLAETDKRNTASNCCWVIHKARLSAALAGAYACPPQAQAGSARNFKQQLSRRRRSAKANYFLYFHTFVRAFLKKRGILRGQKLKEVCPLKRGGCRRDATHAVCAWRGAGGRLPPSKTIRYETFEICLWHLQSCTFSSFFAILFAL
jgi:hypothetical protein